MKKLPWSIRLIMTLAMPLIMSSTFSTAVRAENVVKIGGAGTWLGAMKNLAGAFEKSHPGTKILIVPNLGSSGGIKALVHGKLDVALSARALKAEELKEGAVAVECARTPFVFIVNGNVNKSDLTIRELEMIYGGQVLKWPEGIRIRIVHRLASDSDTTIVKNISKGMELAVKTSEALQNKIIAVTDQNAVEMVVKTPGALGGSTLAQIEFENSPVKVLSLNGIKPTLDALAKGHYPLVKPLYLVTAPTTSETALQFIQFARSAKGRAILAKSGALQTDGDKRSK